MTKVRVKGDSDTATYADDLRRTLRPPPNPGGNRPEISNLSSCGTDWIDYYQADIVVGDPITDLMPANRYGDRLLAALVVSETGTCTGELIRRPDGSATREYDGGTCSFEWTGFTFDAGTETFSADVTLTDTA